MNRRTRLIHKLRGQTAQALCEDCNAWMTYEPHSEDCIYSKGRTMDDNDFYEEDEPPEEIRAAWKNGEKGYTVGPRRLSPEAQAIVDNAVAQIENEIENEDKEEPTYHDYTIRVDWGGMGLWVGIFDGQVCLTSHSVMDAPAPRGEIVDRLVEWDREVRQGKHARYSDRYPGQP